MSITDVAQQGKYLRNRQTGPTTLTLRIGGGNQQFDWGPYGDPAGRDIAFLPPEALNTMEARRAVNLGIFEEVGEDVAREAMNRQATAFQAQAGAETESVLSIIDEAENVIAEGSVDDRGQVQVTQADQPVAKPPVESSTPTGGVMHADEHGNIVEGQALRVTHGPPVQDPNAPLA